MSTFIGDFDSFHKYYGPWVRNRIQQISKPHKYKKQYRCDDCGHIFETLDAAHNQKSRKDIEKEIFDTLVINKTIDLDDFAKRIEEAHSPEAGNLSYICRPCHIKRHHEDDEKNIEAIIDFTLDDLQINKVYRKLKLWDNDKNGIVYKIIKTYIRLCDFYKNNSVNIKDLEIKVDDTRFKNAIVNLYNTSPKNHGKVFNKNGNIICWWEKIDSNLIKKSIT